MSIAYAPVQPSDQFQADALAALSLRCGMPIEPAKRTEHVGRMAGAPLIYFAEQYLRIRGEQLTGYENREEIAMRALQQDGSGRFTDHRASINTPASFPTLMSSLATKIIVDGPADSTPRYEAWCGQYQGNLPDFKPAPIVSLGGTESLDQLMDAEPFREIKLSEEFNDYMECGRYGNVIGITPVMVANNETGTMIQKARNIKRGGRRRLNQLCLAQLSKVLMDGKALFHADHGNLVDTGSGGIPSDDEWQEMLLLAYAQRVIAASGEAQPYADVPLSVVLVPPALERAARRTFDLNTEVKTPATDGNVNIYRGTVTVVVEPDLQRISSAEWYGLCNPQDAPTVIYGFCDGYDVGGKSERWWDPNTKVWWYSTECRFGAAVAEYRNAVKNKGA